MAKKGRDAASSIEDGAQPRRLVQFKANLGTEDAAAFLEALAGALRGGRLVVQASNDNIDVPVASRVRLDVEAKSSRSARKSSVELRLNWPKRDETPEQPPVASAVNGAADDEEVAVAAPAVEGSTVSPEPEAGQTEGTPGPA
jgi:amphi-Trp domain-containing protein